MYKIFHGSHIKTITESDDVLRYLNKIGIQQNITTYRIETSQAVYFSTHGEVVHGTEIGVCVRWDKRDKLLSEYTQSNIPLYNKIAKYIKRYNNINCICA